MNFKAPGTALLMMGSVYALVCASFISAGGSGQDGCNHALQAWFFNYRLDDKIQRIGDHYKDEIERATDKETLETAGGAAAIIMKRQIRFHTGQVPFIQQTTVDLHMDSVSLNLGWSF